MKAILNKLHSYVDTHNFRYKYQFHEYIERKYELKQKDADKFLDDKGRMQIDTYYNSLIKEEKKEEIKPKKVEKEVKKEEKKEEKKEVSKKKDKSNKED